MAISRFAASRLTQGLPKYQTAWDQDNVEQGSIVPIAQVVATTNTADLTFSNIPQIYQDLMIVFTGRRNDAATLANIMITPYNMTSNPATPNGSTHLEGAGANPVTSFRYTNQDAGFVGIIPAANAGTGIFGSVVAYYFNYASSTQFKTYISQSASDINGAGRANLVVNTYRGTNPINQVNVSTFNGSVFFALGSVATLYGIKAGN